MSAESEAIWAENRANIRAGKHEVLIAFPMDSGVPGTHCVVATLWYQPCPVGILWYRNSVKRTYEILSFQVMDELRGSGIGSKLLAGFRRIAEANKATELYTQDVTNLSKGIIAKAGYRKRRDGYWLNLKGKK